THTFDYFGRSGSDWLVSDTVDDPDSITNYQETKTAPIVPLYFIRGQRTGASGAVLPGDPAIYAPGTATANDVVQRRLRRVKHPPRYATFAMGLSGLTIELGDIVSV